MEYNIIAFNCIPSKRLKGLVSKEEDTFKVSPPLASFRYLAPLSFPVRYIIVFFLLMQFSISGIAQLANDDCNGAILLEDVTTFCSGDSEFSNVDAQQEVNSTSCFSADGKDVWFQFRAVERGLRLSVRGNGQGGTLNQPELQLFNTGQCTDQLEVIECVPGNISQIAALDVNVLLPGNTYLFRVQGKNDAEGDFQICLDNYAPPEND